MTCSGESFVFFPPGGSFVCAGSHFLPRLAASFLLPCLCLPPKAKCHHVQLLPLDLVKSHVYFKQNSRFPKVIKMQWFDKNVDITVN